MIDLIKLNKTKNDEEILRVALTLKDAVVTAKRGTSQKYFHFIEDGQFYTFCYDTLKECLVDRHTNLSMWMNAEDIIKADYHSFQIISFIETEEPAIPEMGLCRVWLNNEE